MGDRVEKSPQSYPPHKPNNPSTRDYLSSAIQIDHAFPFPSHYSQMRLLGITTPEGETIRVVEKTYGMKLGESGHAMEMSREQANAMGNLVLQYIDQLHAIGIAVAPVYQVESVPFNDAGGLYGVRVWQAFVDKPNFANVWQSAAQEEDQGAQAQLAQTLLDLVHRISNFRPDSKSSHLFPYAPLDVFDSSIGIDLKPQNFMIDPEKNISAITLVDIVYPPIREANGRFCYLDVVEGSENKDPGWKHLPERLANKKGLYTKIILELAASAENSNKTATTLGFLEALVLDYLREKEDPRVHKELGVEIRSGYRHFREIAGRGEKIRFRTIFGN